MDRLDSWLIATVTKLTLRWIKKNKSTKHKIDFFIVVTGWECAYWVVQMSFSFFRGHNPTFINIMWGFIVAAVVAMEYLKILSLQTMKETYDELWERRKNPVVYQLVKELTDHYCEAAHHKDHRKFFLKFAFGVIILFAYFNPLIVPVYLFFVFNTYHSCIFDFEPPEKKEKKAKASLTEVALNAWKQLTGKLAPNAH